MKAFVNYVKTILWWEWVLLLIGLVALLAYCFRPFNYDEAWNILTVYYQHINVIAIAKHIAPNYHITYSFALLPLVFTDLMGFISLRSPSLISYLVCLGVLLQFFRIWEVGKFARLLFLTAFIFNPISLYLFSTARGYGLSTASHFSILLLCYQLFTVDKFQWEASVSTIAI